MCRMFAVHSFFDEKTQTKLLNSLQNHFQVYLLIKKGKLGFQNGVKIAEILFIYDTIHTELTTLMWIFVYLAVTYITMFTHGYPQKDNFENSNLINETSSFVLLWLNRNENTHSKTFIGYWKTCFACLSQLYI